MGPNPRFPGNPGFPGPGPGPGPPRPGLALALGGGGSGIRGDPGARVCNPCPVFGGFSGCRGPFNKCIFRSGFGVFFCARRGAEIREFPGDFRCGREIGKSGRPGISVEVHISTKSFFSVTRIPMLNNNQITIRISSRNILQIFLQGLSLRFSPIPPPNCPLAVAPLPFSQDILFDHV